MKTYNKDRIGLQEVKTAPTYEIRTIRELQPAFISERISKIVGWDFPEFKDKFRFSVDGNYLCHVFTLDPDNEENATSTFKSKSLFYVQFLKHTPKTPEQIAKETLAGIINEWDVPDPEMSSFTINQMKYALAHASDEAIQEFLFFYYDSDKWLEDYPDPDPEALHNLKIGEFKYSQNFEVIKVETLEETKYWVLNGKHTNELECGRTLVFTNFDPDESNGVDYEEFLFSYMTYTGAEK